MAAKVRPSAKSPRPASEVGTVQHAIDIIVAACQALPYQQQRQKALGTAIAKLIERDMVSGVGAVSGEAMARVNHYSAAIE